MCLVFEAEHVRLGQALAVKALRPEFASNQESVARFAREARAAAQLRSPNVARVYDVDSTPQGQPYITMELLVGHDLGVEMAPRMPLPIALAIDYVRQAAAGIAEAHALGIVHRDLKPENLFLTSLGELTDRKLVKILDFGIAKTLSEETRRLTAPDAVFGTVDYMSPEQIRSASTVDHRSDLWSLGVILYELLTGRSPFRGDARAVIAQIVSDPLPSPATLVPGLPPDLVAIVMKALEKDPADRFQSADDFRAALAPYEDLEPITAVLSALPPESVPRRTASFRPSGLPAGRTNLSWERGRDGAGSGARWLFAATLVLLVVFAGLLGLKPRARTVSGRGQAAHAAPRSTPGPTNAEEAAPAPAPPTTFQGEGSIEELTAEAAVPSSSAPTANPSPSVAPVKLRPRATRPRQAPPSPSTLPRHL